MRFIDPGNGAGLVLEPSNETYQPPRRHIRDTGYNAAPVQMCLARGEDRPVPREQLLPAWSRGGRV